MFQRTAAPQLHRSSWRIARAESPRAWPMQAFGPVAYFFASQPRFLAAHARMKIREPIRGPRPPDGGQTRRIKAEEIYAGLFIQRHVGPDIDFRKIRKTRNWRQKSPANPAHAERHDSNPRLPGKLIQQKLWRHQWTQLFHRDRPMSEQYIVPCLLHDPGRARRRISPMSHRFQQRMHRQV